MRYNSEITTTLYATATKLPPLHTLSSEIITTAYATAAKSTLLHTPQQRNHHHSIRYSSGIITTPYATAAESLPIRYCSRIITTPNPTAAEASPLHKLQQRNHHHCIRCSSEISCTITKNNITIRIMIKLHAEKKVKKMFSKRP